MKRVFLASASLFSASSLLFGAVQADEAALFACINKYKSLGISPDAAMAKCEKTTLAECVKNLVGKNYKANSISKGAEGFIIDLGGDDSRWLEGNGWEGKGCVAYDEGPNKVEITGGRGLLRIGKRTYKWYRQGLCPSDSIEISQPYGLQDARLQCEIDIASPVKD